MELEDAVADGWAVIMRTPAAFALFGALPLLAACGGGDSLQGPPQGPGEEPATLDFSAVAGTWSGWGEVGVVATWLILELNASVRPGKILGASTVGTATSDGDLVEFCAGDLHPLTAAPPEYAASLRYVDQPADCVGGTVALEHDPAAGTLKSDFTAEDNSFTGTHLLTRGSDPGPAP